MVPVDLQGKIALVTGSGRGLGAYMAVGLAKAGADIVVTSRTKAECDRTAAQIRELGRKAVVVTADVSKLSEITRVVDTAVGEFGKLDILVNNAGTNRRVRALDYCEDDYDLVMATNLKAVYFFAQAAARVMAPRKYGKIVNVASVGGVLAELGCQDKPTLVLLNKIDRAHDPATVQKIERITLVNTLQQGALNLHRQEIERLTLENRMQQAWLNEHQANAGRHG